MADIIISNDDTITETQSEARRRYVERKLFDRYITLIQKLVRQEPTHEHPPTRDEAMLTAAYCASRLSSCLKRKVGAVITRGRTGEVLAVGYNEVPEGTEACFKDPNLGGRCARDAAKERFAQKLKCCPNCGTGISVEHQCSHCGHDIDTYFARCPCCKEDPGLVYNCPGSGCGIDVFSNFVPGSSADEGRLLDICRAFHAEETALLNLSKRGTMTPEDAVMYTTTFPCTLCAKKIVSMGVHTVVYAEPYPMPEARRVLEEGRVCMRQFEGVKSAAYFRLYR